MILRCDARGVARQLRHVVEHRALWLGDGRSPIVRLQGADQFFVQCDSTQKLCVRLDSIMATVRDRHDRRDHLVLAARQGQVGRHERAEGGEGVIECVGDEAV